MVGFIDLNNHSHILGQHCFFRYMQGTVLGIGKLVFQSAAEPGIGGR